jgi:hypothetical protein
MDGDHVKVRRKPEPLLVLDAIQFRTGQPLPEGMHPADPRSADQSPVLDQPDGAPSMADGDWILVYPSGERWRCTQEDFKESFEEVTCTNSPPWFVGHWRDWHRGHGCAQDDGRPKSAEATTEIAQHAANETTGYLTDAELSFLRASTTSGNELLVRALDELKQRRTAEKKRTAATFDHSARATKHFEPLLGYCVCDHCAKLPIFESPTQAKEHT